MKNFFDLDFQFFDAILNSLTTGLYVCDNNYVVKYINKAYANYLGHTPEEIVGRHITDFIPDSRAPYVTSTGLPEMGEVRTFKDKKSERTIVVNRYPLKRGNETLGMLSLTLFGSREEFDLVTKRIKFLDKKVMAYARRIKSALSTNYSLSSIIGESYQMKKLISRVQSFGRTDAPVLVIGPTGTGKELVAGAIHCESKCAEGPFVSINCAAIPNELFGSELFGYAPGAFSGAHKDGKIGRIELANGGTLFLDEIGDTPLPVQAKLLRVLENKTLYRVGDNTPRVVDFRLICATNRDLKKMIEEKLFREDLYYRISSLIVDVPPLHERWGDIPLLVDHLLKHMGHSDVTVTDRAMDTLETYCWPGNVRELRNVLTSALSLCRNKVIDFDDLPPELLADYGSCQTPAAQAIRSNSAQIKVTPPVTLPSMLATNELRLILLTLQKNNWNITKSARQMGIARSTLYEKMNKFNISRGCQS